VPEFLVSGAPIKETRPNPTDNTPNSPSISPNKGDSIVNEATEIINNYSLLPEGEDYVRPIGMITLPSVLKKALERDTPQSRAVIAGGLAALGALVGHAVTDNASGAGIGAGTGLAVALLVYRHFNPIIGDHSHEIEVNPDTKQMKDAIRTNQLNYTQYCEN
jgi:hypothetical protein